MLLRTRICEELIVLQLLNREFLALASHSSAQLAVACAAYEQLREGFVGICCLVSHQQVYSHACRPQLVVRVVSVSRARAVRPARRRVSLRSFVFACAKTSFRYIHGVFTYVLALS